MEVITVVLIVSEMVTLGGTTTPFSKNEDFEKLAPLSPPDGIPNAAAAAADFVSDSQQRIYEKFGQLGSGPNPILSAAEEKARREPFMKGSSKKKLDLSSILS